MNELETRIIKVDVAKIRNTLIALGAVKVKEENQVNDIYDFEDGSLLSEKGYARIRSIDDLLNNQKLYYMATKKLISQGSFKEMEENELQITDKDTAEGLFLSLGLVLKQSIKKYRESYNIDNSLVEIDINDSNFCPFPYIEIETDSEENLKKVVEMLGYSLSDTTSKTIYQLIEENK